MKKLIVYLSEKEHNALRDLSKKCLREPRTQAKLILREELIRHKLLDTSFFEAAERYSNGESKESSYEQPG